MMPTDAVVAALQDGFAGIGEQLEDLVTSLRQAHGLDAADEELEELRKANAELASANEHAQQQLEQLRAIVGQQGVPPQTPTSQAPTQVVPAPGPTQATEPVAQTPAPTPPDGQ